MKPIINGSRDTICPKWHNRKNSEQILVWQGVNDDKSFFSRIVNFSVIYLVNSIRITISIITLKPIFFGDLISLSIILPIIKNIRFISLRQKLFESKRYKLWKQFASIKYKISMIERQEGYTCSPHFPVKSCWNLVGFPCIHRVKFYALFKNIFDDFTFLKSADISAFDNIFPTYCWILGVTGLV